MAHRNKVIRSINAPGDARCVDLYQRPNGSFGFAEYRRDAEDVQGWFLLQDAGSEFDTLDATLAAAKDAVPWLGRV